MIGTVRYCHYWCKYDVAEHGDSSKGWKNEIDINILLHRTTSKTHARKWISFCLRKRINIGRRSRDAS